MNEPVTVTYSIEEVLKRMEDKLDKIDTRLNHLEVGQAKLTEKVEGIDNRLKTVEGTQKNQVWALIVLLGGAIVTAGWRVFFTANP
ncbi:MAG: hemolysin XhlA family protein [Crocosphaera sp.]